MKGFDPSPCLCEKDDNTACIIYRCAYRSKKVIKNVCFFTKICKQLTIDKESWYRWEIFIIE